MRRSHPVLRAGVPLLWLRADTATLFQDAGGSSAVTANNDPVRRWNDYLGRSLYASNDADSKRPLYSTSGINSKPALLFDGSDDNLWTSALSLTSGAMLVVAKRTSVGSFPGFCKLAPTAGDTGTNGILQCSQEGVGPHWLFANPSTGTFAKYDSQDLTSGTAYYYYSQWGAAVGDIVVRKNGADMTASGGASYTQPSGTHPLYLASGYSSNLWYGYLGEIIVWTTPPSTGARNAVEQFIAAEWGF